jgi:hypothetical protein
LLCSPCGSPPPAPPKSTPCTPCAQSNPKTENGARCPIHRALFARWVGDPNAQSKCRKRMPHPRWPRTLRNGWEAKIPIVHVPIQPLSEAFFSGTGTPATCLRCRGRSKSHLACGCNDSTRSDNALSGSDSATSQFIRGSTGVQSEFISSAWLSFRPSRRVGITAQPAKRRSQ